MFLIKNYGIRTARELESKGGLEDLWNATGNNHTDQLLKINAIEFLCRFQDEKCLKKASELFNLIPVSYFSSPNSQKNP